MRHEGGRRPQRGCVAACRWQAGGGGAGPMGSADASIGRYGRWDGGLRRFAVGDGSHNSGMERPAIGRPGAAVLGRWVRPMRASAATEDGMAAFEGSPSATAPTTGVCSGLPLAGRGALCQAGGFRPMRASAATEDGMAAFEDSPSATAPTTGVCGGLPLAGRGRRCWADGFGRCEHRPLRKMGWRPSKIRRRRRLPQRGDVAACRCQAGGRCARPVVFGRSAIGRYGRFAAGGRGLGPATGRCALMKAQISLMARVASGKRGAHTG